MFVNVLFHVFMLASTSIVLLIFKKKIVAKLSQQILISRLSYKIYNLESNFSTIILMQWLL